MPTDDFDHNNLIHRNRAEGRTIHGEILELLPQIYHRHSSDYVLKGFTIHLTEQSTYFVATAVAKLGPPKSLDPDFDINLCDEFIEAQDPHTALGALKTLKDFAIERLEKLQKRNNDVPLQWNRLY